MIVVSCVCVGLISGFTYATWRAYQNSHYKNTFTIADTAQDIQGEVEETISKQFACEKINSDLKILGINLLANEDDLHLFRDYKSDEICWEYRNENILVDVDAQKGRLVNYSDLNSQVSTIEYSEELLNRLNVLNDYEMMSDEIVDGNRVIEYAKKYGDIFNKYQSTTVIIKNNKIFNISSVFYEYEDKEIVISKEEALKILKENGVDADDVELAIENVGVMNTEKNEIMNDNISEKNFTENVLDRNQIDIRKVWKTSMNELIDANTGELINNIKNVEIKNMGS